MIIFQKADFQVVADTGEIAGYASKYNGVDSYGDTILPTGSRWRAARTGFMLKAAWI